MSLPKRKLLFEIELSNRAFQELRDDSREKELINILYDAMFRYVYGDTEPPASRRISVVIREVKQPKLVVRELDMRKEK